MSSVPAAAPPWVKQCASAVAPRSHHGGLVSEVAVPGRTAHEGKPASHDMSVPSPPHPPEGAGTLGRYRCGLDQRRPPYQRRRPEAFAFLADAVNYARITRRLPQPGSLPIRCRNPASPGMHFLGLTVPLGAESSGVVRFSVSRAVSFGCYSAGSDNRRCQ